jgi:hypothetical protein
MVSGKVPQNGEGVDLVTCVRHATKAGDECLAPDYRVSNVRRRQADIC